MNAADIMTRSPIAVHPQTSLKEALDCMLEHHLSGLPVIDAEGRLVGIVTEGDLLRRTELGTERQLSRWRALLEGPQHLATDYIQSHARRVEEIMTREVACVAPQATLTEVVQVLESRRIRRVPVLDNDHVVGIVSRSDLLRALGQQLSAPQRAAGSDAEIRQRLLTQIEQQRWAPRACIDVGVTNGVTELRGLILHEAEREALHVMAENTPGVTRVVDRLIWIEPLSGTVAELPPDLTPATRA
ncbi:MAG: CBS domain-containing protein [Steroidobacteraceae bacterium]